jgi:hypothetical protein
MPGGEPRSTVLLVRRHPFRGKPRHGLRGDGDWAAVVKRGKEKIKIAGSQEPVTFEFHEGDKVKVVAKTPGSGAIAGHVD